MANLIATEYYAYSIGGSGSYTSNLGCTKSRATQLNCSVSGSYSNNQLVPQSALSRSSGGSSGGSSSGWTTTSSYSISGYTIYKSYGKEGVANSDTTQQFYWSSGTTVYIGSSSESGYDIVYITNSSGSQVGSSISGSHTPSSLSNMTSVYISSSGYYTIHYKKDGSANSGNDCGYLAVPNGGSSGGGDSSGSYYAYYYVDSSQRYYRTTSSQTRSKSDWSSASNYNYQGYIYYDTLSQALNQYNGSASSCDSTGSTYSGSSTVVVFFFTSSSGGGGGDSGGGSGGDSGGSSTTYVYYYTVDGTQLYSTTGSHTAASNYSGYGLIGRTSSATLSNALSTSGLQQVTTSVSGSYTVFWYANSSNISINISSEPVLTYDTFTYAGQTQTPSRCSADLSVTAGRFTLVPDRYINVLSNSYGISLETTRLMKGTVYSLGSNNSVTCHSYGGKDSDYVYYKLRYTSPLGSSATKTTSEINDTTGFLGPGIVINYE